MPYSRRNIASRYLTESCKKITGLCHIHRWNCRRNITHLYLIESCKKITGLCHIHRRVYRRSILTESLMNYAHPEAHACLTCVRLHTYQWLYRHLLPTDSRTSRSARMCDTCPSARIPTDRKVWQDF